MPAGRRALPLALAFALLALTGCGRSGDRSDVSALTERFYASVAGHHGARACGWLSADARTALEQQESAPCAQAVEHLQLSGRRAQTVRLYSTQAAVSLRGGDTVYLESTPSGWRISAAGCREPGYDQPADCELES
jgi:hypothetical protein